MPRTLRSLVATVLTLVILSVAIPWQGAAKTEPPIEKIPVVNTAPAY